MYKYKCLDCSKEYSSKANRDGCSCPFCGGRLIPVSRQSREDTIIQLRMIADDLEKGCGGFDSLVGIDLAALASEIGTMRNDGLTDQEGRAMDALITAFNEFKKLDSQHPSELSDFTDGIHRCQDLLAVRIARRLYPEGWPTKKKATTPGSKS